MNLSLLFKEFITNNNLFSPKGKLLLAVSGGVDSVVLCELCRQAGFNFSIAHCNFQLRGEESERDELFVKNLAEKYRAEVLVKKFDTENYASKNKLSIQEAARDLRYKWFGELLTPNSELRTPNFELSTPDYLLTAHHLDDNIETLLMNFFKGTGIAGLRGMLPKKDRLVRPLLFAKKEELIAFAKDNKLEWVVDSSNTESKYSRNYFRNTIIPLIQKIYPQAEENLADNLERFRDIEVLYHQSIEQHKKKLLEQKGNEIHIPILKLKKSEPLDTIIYGIIKEFGFSSQQVQELKDLLDAESGRYIQSSTQRIIKNRNWLIIAPVETKDAETILIEESVANVQCSMFNVQFTFVESSSIQLSTSSNTACLDANLVNYPLILRKWKQGDYFYPLGMKKKKKLARFFIDTKLSKTEKEKIWVIESDSKILWVVGYRIDERFKITDKTKSVLKITLHNFQTG
jgi:tRNA(Ile)-lysidine synthase